MPNLEAMPMGPEMMPPAMEPGTENMDKQTVHDSSIMEGQFSMTSAEEARIRMEAKNMGKDPEEAVAEFKRKLTVANLNLKEKQGNIN